MSEPASRGDTLSEIPSARVESRSPGLIGFLQRHPTPFWWLTAFATLVALVLVATEFAWRGPQITIHFEQGHGIKAGDALRMRGVDVGHVVSARLNDHRDAVDVVVVLDPSAAGLAREGSQFWIERPQLRLSRLRGLDTVVGAKYLSVLPGPDDAPSSYEFVGLESPRRLLEAGTTEIEIRFRNGNGLAVGDALKFRGIDVGEVVGVELRRELALVHVFVRLTEGARALARVGSQFWVERPKVSAAEVRGLDTLVSGRYLAVLPGPTGAEPHYRFDGLDTPPPISDPPAGGLEIVLESLQRGGLSSGIPITYRGLHVGHVMTVGLSNDSASVEARAYILPAYAPLVRDNTKFWSASGIDVSIGITGVELDMDTLSSIATGAVGMATPDVPGYRVTTGHRFRFYDDAEKHWENWRPRIAIGSALLPADAPLPEMRRVARRWVDPILGIGRDRKIQGWALLLEDGRLLTSQQLLALPENEKDEDVFLEFEGEEVRLDQETVEMVGEVATLRLPSSVTLVTNGWPFTRIRYPDKPEDCLVVTGVAGDELPLPAARISQRDGQWDVDPALPLAADWQGATVVAAKDGWLIGILAFDKGQARVVRLALAER